MPQALALGFVFATAFIFHPKDIRAADCATCHPQEAALHSRSAHAIALQPPAPSLFAARLSGNPLFESPQGYSFQYQRSPGGLDVTARRGKESATASIAWVFGSGKQGQTPMLFYRGHFVEHRVSLYSSTGYGITIGQQEGVSPSKETALGRAESKEDARACFACHATVLDRNLASFTPGVECVRCHAGAEKHADGEGLPVNPGRLEHRAQMQLCGTCHRVKPPSGNQDDIGNVRFQPLRLMRSACFRKSAISCTTCHAAHRDAARNSSEAYNRRCTECHQNKMAHVARLKDDNCVGCHMPVVKPAPGLSFTDHYIRIAYFR